MIQSLLTVVPEVFDEVCLGTESAKQLLRHMTTLFGAHQLLLLLLLAVHKDTIFKFNIYCTIRAC